MQLQLFEFELTDFYNRIFNAFPENESQDLEYKSAIGGFPKEFWKTYSAFANTSGGIIVLGISEKKGKINLDGFDDGQISKLKKEFWDGANNPTTINRNLLKNEDVKVLEYEGKKFIVFNIPPAKRIEKPIHLTRSAFQNTYKRNYEGDYKCTDEEVRRMMADSDTSLHHDSRVLPNYTMEDVDIDSLRKYRQLLSADKPAHPWLVLNDLELLKQLGGYRRDRTTKQEGFTLAGLLMFGKTQSITDIECAPYFFPDYRENLSDNPEIRWTDRVYPDGTWEANLFQFYLKIWPLVSAKLPKPFLLKEGVRRDETPAHVALREAFINALVHTDYTANGSIIIEHKKDSFVFSNPGTLLVSLQQYYHGGISECRNPNLQKMFMMIGSAEKAGSGVNKIMASWDAAHWRTPYLFLSAQPDRIELNLPMFSILPTDTLEELKNRFGDEIQTLGKDELTVLSICQIEGEVTNNRLQYVIDQHRSEITKLLQQLCKDGYLISENKGRWTTYHLVDSSTPKVDSSASKVDSSASKVDSSASKVDSSVSQLMKRKVPKDELFAHICLITKDDYRSLEEIALQVGRSVDYLKNKIIPDMLKKGLIERLYPDNFTHPHQGYRAKG